VDEVFLNVFKDPKHILVAVCDRNLLGSTFREGRMKLEVKADFYKGVPASIEEALKAIDSADLANLVGKGIVDAAVREGLADSSAVLHIDGVPHVQIVRL